MRIKAGWQRLLGLAVYYCSVPRGGSRIRAVRVVSALIEQSLLAVYGGVTSVAIMINLETAENSLKILRLMLRLFFQLRCVEGKEQIRVMKTKPSLKDAAHSLHLKWGDHQLTLDLEVSGTSLDLQALLPLQLELVDLNRNEKYADLPEELSGQAKRVRQINAGDVMIFAGNSLVLFYESFSTPYSYVRLGSIREKDQLADLIGSKVRRFTATLEVAS